MKNLFLLTLPLAAFSLSSVSHGQSVGYAASITDLGAPNLSGFFQASGTITGDIPDTSHTFAHLINVRHSNVNNNHQFQFASSYAENDRFFFRKIATGANGSRNTAWHEVATRGSNSFTGSQTVNGSITISQQITSAGFYTAAGVIYIKPQNSSNEGGHLQFLAPNSSQQNWNIDHYAGNLRFYMSGGGGVSHYFHSNGNVGIGTSTPDYKLDVNGGIRAKEFFVQTGWSDFVFEEDYALPTLAEVEAHIAERGHLPGVPSAAEVQANGLEMGQAQTFMMQKIEELTLYVLQLSKENQSLRSEMESLRTSIEAR